MKQSESGFNKWDHHLKWKDEYDGVGKTYNEKTGHRNHPPHDLEAKAEQEHSDHIDKVKAKLNIDLQDVIGTIRKWRLLANAASPLPDPNNPLLPDKKPSCSGGVQ